MDPGFPTAVVAGRCFHRHVSDYGGGGRLSNMTCIMG